MKKKLTLVLAILLVFAMFAGCGGGGTQPTKAPDDDTWYLPSLWRTAPGGG